MTKTDTKQQTPIRPPVVVVMGHIDHGKTTLLDYIRKENVAHSEAGSITQHVGAYEAEVDDPKGARKRITFIDTPGHEAFSQMRSRGAEVADIAILVVAADDGVKPQTAEAIETIQNAGVPFVIAINKTDKPNANPEQVKKELSEKEVNVEERGGNVPAVSISAKTGDGIPDLLEMVLLLAELEDIRADAECPATGVVIESHLDRKRGNTATLLITEGTLHRGEYVVAGSAYSPVRIFEDFRGKSISEASPSQPVRIIGFTDAPQVGMQFHAVPTKKDAEKYAADFSEKNTSKEQPQPEKPSFDEDEEADTVIPVVPLVLKADTIGSLEAIETELKKFQSEKFEIKIIKKGVGAINEDDAKVAGSKKGSAVVGFNVSIEKEAPPAAERFSVTIKTFSIIYELLEWLKYYIQEQLPRETVEESIGKARIIKTFSQKGSKQVVGGKVTSGVIRDNAKVRILRRNQHIGNGTIIELQQLKNEVSEVTEENEFGAMIDASVEIAARDVIEIVEEKTVQHEL